MVVHPRTSAPPSGPVGDCQCLCGNGERSSILNISRTKQALTPGVSLKVSARVRVQ